MTWDKGNVSPKACFLDHRHLSLKVQYAEFAIDVWSTIHRNLALNTHLHAIIRPHFNIEFDFDVCVRWCNLTSNTQCRIQCLVFSAIEFYDDSTVFFYPELVRRQPSTGHQHRQNKRHVPETGHLLFVWSRYVQKPQ